MNTDKETKQRFKRKLLNACNTIDGLVEFVQVHNEDDETAAARRGNETLDELSAIAGSLGRMFDRLK